MSKRCKYGIDYRLEVERFKRDGRIITLAIRVAHTVRPRVQTAPPPLQSVYVIANLPNRLPAGNYVAHVRINDGAAKGKPSISCLIQIPNVGVSAELKKLAAAAIDIKPKGPLEQPRGSDQRPIGLDLPTILKLTGQDKDRAKFPQDQRSFAAGVNKLVQAKRAWALCSLLDHPNVAAKILAAGGLGKLAQVPQ